MKRAQYGSVCMNVCLFHNLSNPGTNERKHERVEPRPDCISTRRSEYRRTGYLRSCFFVCSREQLSPDRFARAARSREREGARAGESSADDRDGDGCRRGRDRFALAPESPHPSVRCG